MVRVRVRIRVSVIVYGLRLGLGLWLGLGLGLGLGPRFRVRDGLTNLCTIEPSDYRHQTMILLWLTLQVGANIELASSQLTSIITFNPVFLLVNHAQVTHSDVFLLNVTRYSNN